jgi:hypothetical protein
MKEILECLSEIQKSTDVRVVIKLFSMLKQYQLQENNGIRHVIDVVCEFS